MYTADELISYARQAGINVSRRQIWEWKRDGLLPKPVRIATSAQRRGGIPDRYPDSAPAAAVWLGRYRRKIDGIDATRFWMWLDGVLDDPNIDINTLVLNRCQQIWQRWQAQLASLPDLDTLTLLSEEQRDAILDEISAQMLLRAEARSKQPPLSYGHTMMRVAFLGLYLGQEDRLTEIVDPEILEQLAQRTHANVPVVVRDSNMLNLYHIVKRHMIDWAEVRRVWAATREHYVTHDLLLGYRFKIIGLVATYWHEHMNLVAEGFTFGMEILRFMLDEEADERDDNDKKVKDWVKSRMRVTAEHFRTHGFVPTQRPAIDTSIFRLLGEQEE